MQTRYMTAANTASWVSSAVPLSLLETNTECDFVLISVAKSLEKKETSQSKQAQ